MDYSLTDEQKQIVDAARKFARNEFPPIARECDREEKFPKEVWAKAGALGFMGILISSGCQADWGSAAWNTPW